MKAYELLSDKSRWTTRACARDINGQPLNINNNDAVSWCILGAIGRCYPNQFNTMYKKVVSYAGQNLSFINDTKGYEAVIDLLKGANV